MKYKPTGLPKIIPAVVCLLLVANQTFAQKPNTQTQPAAPTQTVNPVPAAYGAGVKVNYVRTWEPAKPLTDPAAVIAETNVSNVRQSTQYVDGLGRLSNTNLTVKDVLEAANQLDVKGNRPKTYLFGNDLIRKK